MRMRTKVESTRKTPGGRRSASFLVLGVGSFAYSISQTLKDDGAGAATYLTRNYGHYPPSLAGRMFSREAFPSPCPLLKAEGIDCVIPQSIDWAQAPWADELARSSVPIFSPTGEAMRIERERDYARRLCADFGIPFPRAFVASNRLEAEKVLAAYPRPYVIKNPLCSPVSPVHTIVCETVEDTRAWLRQVNYAEGVFLQQYLGRAEAGHIVLVSGGEIHSLVTNQEYKRAFNGNMGIIAGAPLGGLVEKDPGDKYGLARQLIHPLLPWLRKTRFHGPLQVTAVKKDRRWHVIEYNVRIGVTSGPMILRMLANPAQTVLATARDESLEPRFKTGVGFGCSLTLAGYGYPFVQVRGPQVPLEVDGAFDCDVWWNEVERSQAGDLVAVGHRIADLNALAATLDEAIAKAYDNIRRIRVLGSYYRTDVGKSLWPPGKA
jgi:phosphoribosylamine-glycine ligase